MPNQPVLPFSNLPQQPLGALTGWEGGFNSALGIDQQEANRRDQEIQAQLEQNKLLNAQLDNPVLAAKRALDLTKTGEEQHAYDTGEIPSQLSAARQAATSKSLADKSVTELTQASVKAQNVVSFAETLKDASPADLAVPGGKWDTIKETGKKLGLPKEWFPDQYTPEAGAQIQQAANFAVKSQPFLQQQLLLRTKSEGALAGIKESGAQARQTFQESIPGRVEIAHAGMQNQLMLRMANMSPGQQNTYLIQQKINNDIPLNENDLQAAEAAVVEKLKASAPNLENDYAKTIMGDFLNNPDKMQKYLKSKGLPKDTSPADASYLAAQDQYRETVQKQTLQQYANAKFVIHGQPMQVKNGKLAPVTGKAAATNKPAPQTSTPEAPVTPQVPAPVSQSQPDMSLGAELGGASPSTSTVVPSQPTSGGVAPPKAGDIIQGYRFKGGDPSDKKNYEKVK